MSREAPSLSSLEEGAVSILDAETSRDVTFYLIQVALKTGEAWKIARRYSQFKDLHDRLLSMFSIGDSSLLHLPPKRIFNNNDPNFIRKRKAELQEYLRSVILNLVPPCPHPLRVFLTESLYDFQDIDSAIASSGPSATIMSTKAQSGATPNAITASTTAWGDDNCGALIDMSSPRPENAPAFSPTFSPFPAPFNHPASKPHLDAFSGGHSQPTSNLDAFGMPIFGVDDGDSKPNSSVASATKSSPASSSSSIKSPLQSESASSTKSSLFSPEIGDETCRKSKSKWFDHEPVKRSSELRLDHASGRLIRDALSSGTLANGARCSPASGALADGALSGYSNHQSEGKLASVIPAFSDLHSKYHKQICSTYADWKRTSGINSTIFVNDLISF